MEVLHLGINDVPYEDNIHTSTGFVAEELEKNYGIMGFFFENNSQSIADDAVQTYLDVISGKDNRIFGESLLVTKVNDKFRRFLDSKAMDRKINGVPTKASLLGKSKKLKRNKGPVRPSFIDSGLYQDNFKAWLDNK